MGRKLRICEPNLTYHTYVRCCNKDDLMHLNKHKDLMLQVINMALEKYEYKFELNHFEILSNHFHLIITTLECGPTISRIMQFINSQYSRRYNKMMNRSGPLWNERFGDKIIEHSRNPVFYILYLFCYLAYNSVRKSYVRDPRDYKYSSINFLLDENFKAPVRLTFHKYFLELGHTFEERRKKILEYETLYRGILYDKLNFI